MPVSVEKKTLERLQEHSQRGEKHDNLINRLIDYCEEQKKSISLSDKTVKRLKVFTGSADVDEAISFLIDKFKKNKEKKRGM
jgi:hypothetical protein